MKLFSIYDSKAQAFLTPFFSKNDATAIRDFAHAANQESHSFHRNAGDYTLVALGEWDEQEGIVDLYEAHENLGTALQHIVPINPLPAEHVDFNGKES
ncbi:nonstructural protein [Microviridae sp.]|nr:nonstructural protein [Microviridae sp.]